MKLVASLDSNRQLLSWGAELNTEPTGTIERIEVGPPPRDLKRPVLDNDNVTWIEAPDSVSELQSKKLIEIKEAFEAAKEATISYNDNVYDMTTTSKQNLNHMITVMQLSSDIMNVEWRDASNVNQILVLADLIAMGVLAVKQEQNVHKTFWGLKDELKLADNKTKIENIIWPEEIL